MARWIDGDKLIEKLKESVFDADDLEWNKALIANAPSIDMRDYIKRSDAVKAYNEAIDELVKWQMEEFGLLDFTECEFDTTALKHIARKLEAIPSADRPQGEWIFKTVFPNDESEFPMGYLVCSVCGSHHSNSTPCNYCDNCGARMKGAEDE